MYIDFHELYARLWYVFVSEWEREREREREREWVSEWVRASKRTWTLSFSADRWSTVNFTKGSKIGVTSKITRSELGILHLPDEYFRERAVIRTLIAQLLTKVATKRDRGRVDIRDLPWQQSFSRRVVVNSETYYAHSWSQKSELEGEEDALVCQRSCDASHTFIYSWSN